MIWRLGAGRGREQRPRPSGKGQLLGPAVFTHAVFSTLGLNVSGCAHVRVWRPCRWGRGGAGWAGSGCWWLNRASPRHERFLLSLLSKPAHTGPFLGFSPARSVAPPPPHVQPTPLLKARGGSGPSRECTVLGAPREAQARGWLARQPCLGTSFLQPGAAAAPWSPGGRLRGWEPGRGLLC